LPTEKGKEIGELPKKEGSFTQLPNNPPGTKTPESTMKRILKRFTKGDLQGRRPAKIYLAKERVVEQKKVNPQTGGALTGGGWELRG
jgi:hypothetical protein